MQESNRASHLTCKDIDRSLSSLTNQMEAKKVNPNTTRVGRLYEALASRNKNISGSGLIADDDLEWWFHGPQNCHYMMKILTGKSSPSNFKFRPRSIDSIDDECVIVEGWEGDEVYWVHVWTLKDGLITHLREYFNTCLTVKDLRPPCMRATTLWQSHPRDFPDRAYACHLIQQHVYRMLIL